MKNIDILYEDDSCMILNKAAGLAVQGGNKVSVSLDSILAHEIEPKPLLVHRLDKDTSGAILVAKNKKAAGYYSSLFASRDTQKLYLALCAGVPEKKSGRIEEALIVNGVSRTAITDYTVVAEGDSFSLIQLKLGTGRMHQIRRHLAHIGNPILGDDKYGDFSLNKVIKKNHGIKKLLLHAWKLNIPGPDREILVEAPLPIYFREALDKFTIHFPCL